MACRCKNHDKIVCLNCGLKFEVCNYRKKTAKFCSYKCLGSFTGKQQHLLAEEKKIKKECLNCGISFNVEKWREKKAKYCSTKCQLEVLGRRRGKDVPSWKGGITPLRKTIRTSREYKEWRKTVYERDNYTCQICGKRGKCLEVDHFPLSFSFLIIKMQKIYKNKIIENYKEFVPLWDISNGRTLCKDCHKDTDNYGGKGRSKK